MAQQMPMCAVGDRDQSLVAVRHACHDACIPTRLQHPAGDQKVELLLNEYSLLLS
jgi:hypothetical protein